jgi:hypothetical protein
MLNQESIDVATEICIGAARLLKKRCAFGGARLLQGGKEYFPFGHGTNPSQEAAISLNA